MFLALSYDEVVVHDLLKWIVRQAATEFIGMKNAPLIGAGSMFAVPYNKSSLRRLSAAMPNISVGMSSNSDVRACFQ